MPLSRASARQGEAEVVVAARQDDPARSKIADPIFGNREWKDLAINPTLAHAARDQLGYLAAEIEDQDAIGHFQRPVFMDRGLPRCARPLE